MQLVCLTPLPRENRPNKSVQRMSARPSGLMGFVGRALIADLCRSATAHP
jgi:hypothetical protein